MLLSVADGTSVINEGVWDNRYRYLDQLSSMRAQVRVDGKTAIINGVEELSPAAVSAVDLRAGAALIIAGLMTKGETSVGQIQYIDRGYEFIAEKFSALGADIKRVSVPDEVQNIKLA